LEGRTKAFSSVKDRLLSDLFSKLTVQKFEVASIFKRTIPPPLPDTRVRVKNGTLIESGHLEPDRQDDAKSNYWLSGRAYTPSLVNMTGTMFPSSSKYIRSMHVTR